ncbi:MAG: DUF6236 family protein [Eubacteriales bacterium]
MAFTKALFYPWIDIRDEAWLKSAMLYWENIQTIVPMTFKQPYTNRTAKEFYDEGLLLPFYVQSGMEDIKKLTDDVLKYLDSPEGAEVLMPREYIDYSFVHPNKLPNEIREIVEIHPEKLPYEIRHRIEKDINRVDWISVDSRFANFYMTLLATRLSDRTGAGLLTETTVNNKLSNAAKLDAKLSLPRRRSYNCDDSIDDRNVPLSLAQGILADLIIEKIQIDPATPVKKIIKFRADHADKLGRFRTKIGELTETISDEQPLERLRQQVEENNINEVRPAVNSLKEGLTDSRIEWTTKNFLKVAFFSTSSTSFPLTLLGLSAPLALLMGVGVSLTASAILYNREKAVKLRNNPFSYLLAVDRELH